MLKNITRNILLIEVDFTMVNIVIDFLRTEKYIYVEWKFPDIYLYNRFIHSNYTLQML